MKKIKFYILTLLFLAVLTTVSNVPIPGTIVAVKAATIKISHSEISVPVNTTKLLSVTGTSKKVTWSSSNKSVAVVSSIGYVTGKSEGTATITASVSGKTLKCKVKVYIPMSISSTTVTLNAGKSEALEVIGAPKTPTWTSSNKNIAKVSKYGTVTGVSKGSAVITATVGTTKLTSKVTVLEPITISNKSVSLTEGQSQGLKINGISYRAVWSSSNTSVAMVSMYGTVTALKAGKATITAFVDGEKLTCTVTVAKASNISESIVVLKTGEKSEALKPAIVTETPTDTGSTTVTGSAITTDVVAPTESATTEDSVTPTDTTTDGTSTSEDSSDTTPVLLWTSSDLKVATVSADGIISGIKPGTAVITATYGEQKFTYLVIILSSYNSLLSKAPFAAYEESYDRLNFVLPSQWEVEKNTDPSGCVYIAYTDADGSNVILIIQKNDTFAPNYFTAKKELKNLNSLDNLKSQYEYALMHTGISFSIKNYKQGDYQLNIGKALKTQFTTYLGGVKMKQTVYDLHLEKYTIEMAVTDCQNSSELTKVSEYILNSMNVK